MVIMSYNTLHCIDISGSMTNAQLDIARKEVLKRLANDHLIAVFDNNFTFIKDVYEDFSKYQSAGVTYAEPILNIAKSLKLETILYSDGDLLPEEISQFSQFIKV
jgi:predicted metal-dependent peptidase